MTQDGCRSDMNGQSRVALNLRRIRVERGLTQETLANDAGVAIPYLSNLERGLRNPSIELLERLATVLRVDLAELVAPISPNESLRPNLPAGRKPG